MPNSAKLNKPNIFWSVDVKPTNSLPKLSIKIFREKNVATELILCKIID